MPECALGAIMAYITEVVEKVVFMVIAVLVAASSFIILVLDFFVHVVLVSCFAKGVGDRVI